VNKKYRFRYNRKGIPEIQVEDIVATSPISACNQFHTALQLHKEMADDRKTVIRPILSPDEYDVVSMHQIYHDASFHKSPSSQPIVESSIDYPKSVNPDLRDHNKRGLAGVLGDGKSNQEFDFGANKGEN
jgi:hypothetical protein